MLLFGHSGSHPTCAEVLEADKLHRLAGQVITNVIKRKWWFGLEPFTCARRAPVVSFFRLLLS